MNKALRKVTIACVVLSFILLIALLYVNGNKIGTQVSNIAEEVVVEENHRDLRNIDIEKISDNWEETSYDIIKNPKQLEEDVETLRSQAWKTISYYVGENKVFSLYTNYQSEIDYDVCFKLSCSNQEWILDDWKILTTGDTSYILITKLPVKDYPLNEGKYAQISFDNKGNFLEKRDIFIDLAGSDYNEKDADSVTVIPGIEATIVQHGNEFATVRKGKTISITTFPEDATIPFDPFKNYYLCNSNLYYVLVYKTDYDNVGIDFSKVATDVEELDWNYEVYVDNISYPVVKKDGNYRVYSMDAETYKYKCLYNNSNSEYNEKAINEKNMVKENILSNEPIEFSLEYKTNYISKTAIPVENYWEIKLYYADEIYTCDKLVGFDESITSRLTDEETEAFTKKKFKYSEIDEVKENLRKLYEKHADESFENFLIK